MDYEGIKKLLRRADVEFPRFSHLWLDAGYRGEDKGKGWVERVARRTPAQACLKGSCLWHRLKAVKKEGVAVNWGQLLPPKGFQVLPRCWVVEGTFYWIDQTRRMGEDYERLSETSEAFIYVAMSSLMVRRLARF